MCVLWSSVTHRYIVMVRMVVVEVCVCGPGTIKGTRRGHINHDQTGIGCHILTTRGIHCYIECHTGIAEGLVSQCDYTISLRMCR